MSWPTTPEELMAHKAAGPVAKLHGLELSWWVVVRHRRSSTWPGNDDLDMAAADIAGLEGDDRNDVLAMAPRVAACISDILVAIAGTEYATWCAGQRLLMDGIREASSGIQGIKAEDRADIIVKRLKMQVEIEALRARQEAVSRRLFGSEANEPTQLSWRNSGKGWSAKAEDEE